MFDMVSGPFSHLSGDNKIPFSTVGSPTPTRLGQGRGEEVLGPPLTSLSGWGFVPRRGVPLVSWRHSTNT